MMMFRGGTPGVENPGQGQVGGAPDMQGFLQMLRGGGMGKPALAGGGAMGGAMPPPMQGGEQGVAMGRPPMPGGMGQPMPGPMGQGGPDQLAGGSDGQSPLMQLIRGVGSQMMGGPMGGQQQPMGQPDAGAAPFSSMFRRPQPGMAPGLGERSNESRMGVPVGANSRMRSRQPMFFPPFVPQGSSSPGAMGGGGPPMQLLSMLARRGQ